MKQGGWLFKGGPHQQGLLGAVITLVVLLGGWWVAHRWFEASLLAEARGQLVVVERSIWALQSTGLVVVGLGSVLAYLVISRQARLSQTVESQFEALSQAQLFLEQRVAERTRELETLLQVSRDLTGTLELGTLLGRILEQLRQVVDYDVAAVCDLVDGEQLRLLHSVGVFSSDRAADRWLLADFPFTEPLFQRQQPVLIPDTQAGTPIAEDWRASVGPILDYVRSWLSVPLSLKGRPIGLLAFGHRQADLYTSRHAELALALAGQAAIAIENARLYEQAQALASLEERRHLARELHDSVSQALYGIALGTRTARMLLDRDPKRLAEPLDYIMNLADAGLSEMRALIFELRPEVLEAEGLVAGLTKQAEAIQVRHKLQVTVNLGEEPDTPLTVKEALYRIAQEATHNVVKHAKATEIKLALHNANGLTLEIRDNGRGFDPGQSFPGHLGLRSMRERVERLQGRFEVESKPGQGTTVRVWLPAPG